MSVLDGLPAPTAIEPQRVLILSDAEQRLLIDTIDGAVDGAVEAERIIAGPGATHDAETQRLLGLLAYGEEYNNPADELTRVTLRKRRLEAEVRRCNQRIADLEPEIIDEWSEQGISGIRHDATGASLGRDDRVWAKLNIDTSDMTREQADRAKAAVKAAAADALAADEETADFVRNDFNLNTISAYFREIYKAYNDAQRELPEHERTPRPVESFLPEALRPFLRLDATPHITVRA
jgi:hypothetical protein